MDGNNRAIKGKHDFSNLHAFPRPWQKINIAKEGYLINILLKL